VIAEITLRRMTRPAGAPAAIPQVIYRQRMMSVVQLAKRSYEPRENANSWAADHGRLARAALIVAFKGFETLLPDALNLDDKQIAAFDSKKLEKVFAAGINGPVVRRDGPDSLTIWSKGLISIRTIS
jgi:hypothetical protein